MEHQLCFVNVHRPYVCAERKPLPAASKYFNPAEDEVVEDAEDLIPIDVPFRVRFRKEELSISDLALICHSFVFTDHVFRPKWFNCTPTGRTRSMILTRVDCTDSSLDNVMLMGDFTKKFLPSEGVPVKREALDKKSYWDALLNVRINKLARIRSVVYKLGDPIKKQCLVEKNTIGAEKKPDEESNSQKNPFYRGTSRRQNTPNKLRKVELLTTICQMLHNSYPFPGIETYTPPGFPPVVATKEKFQWPDEMAPIFYLDCEMCTTDGGYQEVTRVTLLNQDGDCVLDTFVKPHNEITNFLTCYSGVNKESLEGVNVRLTDVQAAFQRVLPPNAILCGHSIDNDLRGLRLFHPWCIDIGSVYNLAKRRWRTSLRGLAYFILNQRIHTSGKGHCSYEDAHVTMQLLKLKLEKKRNFGNTHWEWDYVAWAERAGLKHNAAYFKSVEIKDIPKEEHTTPTLPVPREVRKCLKCSASIMSQCSIDKCQCKARAPRYCCLCVGLEIKYPEPPEAKQFDYEQYINFVRNSPDQITNLATLMKEYAQHKVLIGRYADPTHFQCDTSEKSNLTFCDMGTYGTIEDIKKRLLEQHASESNLCLLEYNATDDKTACQVDEVIKAVYDTSKHHGLLAFLFCTPTRALLYANTEAEVRED